MENIDTKAYATTTGAMVALQELGVPPDEFLKVAKNIDRLYSSADRAPVMRKAAGIIATLLENNESTKGRFGSNLMHLMSKSAVWHEAYDDYLRAAFTPVMEKQASGQKAGLGILGHAASKTPGGILGLLGILGALGGAAGHYVGKQVNDDHIDVEKERAKQNEYRKLLDEIDRKITFKAKN